MNDADDKTWEIFDFYFLFNSAKTNESSQYFLNCLVNDIGTMNFKDILVLDLLSVVLNMYLFLPFLYQGPV